jgi:hypothetical protein
MRIVFYQEITTTHRVVRYKRVSRLLPVRRIGSHRLVLARSLFGILASKMIVSVISTTHGYQTTHALVAHATPRAVVMC